MKKTITAVAALLLGAVVVLAQSPDVRMAGGPGRPGGGPGGFGGRGGNEMMGFGGRVVTGAPYSGTETLTIAEKFADGNTVNTTTTTLKARDGQGRTSVTETITPAAASGKAPYTRTIITDPVAGLRYELNSSTMVAVQTRMPKMRPEPPTGSSSTSASAAMRTKAPGSTPGTVTRPNGATVTTSSNGTATVNGVLATHTLVSEVIPAGAIGNANPITTSRTTYVSTDLKVPVQIKTVDPRVGTTDMELTNISTGEPSAALFAVPAGYTIKKEAEGRGGPGGPGGPGGFGRRGGSPPPQQ